MIDEQVIQKIEQVLEMLRPRIQMDGGDIRFVRLENNIVYVQLEGACVGCPASMYTLKLGIEQTLKEQVPTIREVVSV